MFESQFDFSDLHPLTGLSDYSTLNSSEATQISQNSLSPNTKKIVLDLLKPSRDKNNRFHWDAYSSQIFAVIASCIGLKQATPRSILQFMPKQLDLDQGNVGSHLQKYRKKVMDQYHIENIKMIENWMVPEENYNKEIQIITEQWKNQNFQGFSTQDIYTKLYEIQ